jgi:hypothetical protein
MPLRHLITALLFLCNSALAAESVGKPATLADIVAAQQTLRADIAAGKQTFAPDSEKKLLKAQDELFEVAKNNPTDADLNEDEWVKVFNAQELINQIVQNSAADQRKVCHRDRPTGSNRTRSICHTVAEWRAMQPNQSDLLRMSRDIGPSPRPSGG